MPRATMTALIARVKAMCNSDTSLSDNDYQTLLDDHAIIVDSYLEPRVPFYTQHVSPFENVESGSACIIYYGYNTQLIETTDYTADYQRGIFTTPAADYRGLKIYGVAYDIHAAAADGWERLAEASAGAFAWSDVEGSYHPEQARQFKLEQAKAHRRKAWAIGRTVERADTPALLARDWRGDLLRRERAGHTGA